MRAEIRCQTCNELMGTIDKPEITAEDIEKYQQMMTCSSGHSSVELIEE